MKNKKGFTLIELLAVIVILAIIMVIAIPQILRLFEISKQSAWESSAKLVKKVIEQNAVSIDPKTKKYDTTPQILCGNETSDDKDVSGNFTEIIKLNDMNIKCKKSGNYIFTLQGKNKFEGREATISCTNDAVCSITIAQGSENGSSGNNSGSGSNSGSSGGQQGTTYTYEGPGGSGNSINSFWGAYIRTNQSGYKEVCKVFDKGTACLGKNDFPNNVTAKESEFYAVMNAYGECSHNEYGINCNAEGTCMNTGTAPDGDHECEPGSSLTYDGDAYCELDYEDGETSITCSNFGDYSCQLVYDSNGQLTYSGCWGND